MDILYPAALGREVRQARVPGIVEREPALFPADGEAGLLAGAVPLGV